MSNHRKRSRRSSPTRVTRSMTALQKQPRLMPLHDLKRPFSNCPLKSEMLKKQYNDVLKFIEDDNHPEKSPTPSPDASPVSLRVYRLTPDMHTDDSEIDALDEIGVLWCGASPPRRKRTDEEKAEYEWNKNMSNLIDIVTRNANLAQKDLVHLLYVSRMVYNALTAIFGIWKSLDFRWMKNAGDRLVSALSMARYHHNVEHINLAFAEDIGNNHFKQLSIKSENPLAYLDSLNLDGLAISDSGMKDIAAVCPRLKKLSIGKNLRVTDIGINSLGKSCKFLTYLNVSGCEKLTDRCLKTLSKFCTLTFIDVDRCNGIERRSREELLQLFPKLQ